MTLKSIAACLITGLILLGLVRINGPIVDRALAGESLDSVIRSSDLEPQTRRLDCCCSCRESCAGASPDIQPVTLEVRPGYDVLALVDRTHETLSIYQYDTSRPMHERLVLLAARSIKYDRQLAAYNTATPLPDDIRRQVEP